MTDEAEILFRRSGALGVITLNRPKALNSLTLGMIREFDRQLREWRQDSSLAVVAIEGAGEKAFCAGGDVRAVWEAGKRGEVGQGLTADFFREEYQLNHLIHHYPKPIVALIDGITMGGGVGVSIHCSHRVVGARTLFAMPETAIGLFPDVGGSYFLPRLPGKSGLYLALTGARLKAADCCFLGIATDHCDSETLSGLLESLASGDYEGGDAKRVASNIIGGFRTDPGEAPIASAMASINDAFGGDDVFAILQRLSEMPGDWARETLETLRKRSPFSVMLAFEQLRRGAALSFDDCMIMEYRLSQAMMKDGDFYEGIRAVLVEKDHAPRWKPARLEDVEAAEIEASFTSLGARDLAFA
ncbi:enoyl-CoA hydratase/isomerase family protein [Limibacillus halophilus]|uniref:3-hydroxyisobutyryl-CoA hydrolase n=1 Tax=Limibacillus halophilus TaxID=1579333 RepID=A0A839STB6_9PROT|nr:enoyl-CoA hydratase/isomerase family protein [Limibacillus halophilus]MBB3065722.1 enoyl-CoA hydratase [Limibacillus halophilus]